MTIIRNGIRSKDEDYADIRRVIREYYEQFHT